MMEKVFATCSVIACFVFIGCGQAKLPTVKVQGQVTLDGKPYGPATVSLSPTAEADKKTPNAMGQVSTDGKVEVNSYGPKTGIVPGTYFVSLGLDPSTFTTLPVVKPLQVTVAKDQSSLDIKFETMKGKKPGFIPDPSSSGAATDLAPLGMPKK